MPSFITFSSVCEQTEDMPVGIAEQVLVSVYDVLDQASRLLFFDCRRFSELPAIFLLAAEFLLNSKRLTFGRTGVPGMKLSKIFAFVYNLCNIFSHYMASFFVLCNIFGRC